MLCEVIYDFSSINKYELISEFLTLLSIVYPLMWWVSDSCWHWSGERERVVMLHSSQSDSSLIKVVLIVT